MRPLSSTIEELEASMRDCEQMKGLSVLAHGEMVHSHYQKLLETIGEDEFLNAIYQVSKNSIADLTTMRRYHVYHDCGKPLVKDAEGRFPEHEKASAAQWSFLYPEDSVVIDLMSKDMLFHTLRGEEVVALWSDPLAPSLYFTAWAELYANAEMFGGRDSDSFKIKRKRLMQAGKKFISASCVSV